MKKEIWIKGVLFSVVLCIAPFTVASAREAQPSPDDFGGKCSFGPAIGGGGTVGFPLRYYFTQEIILELGPYIKGIYNWNSATEEYGINVIVAGGFVFYLDKKYIDYKQKCISNGFFIKGGYSFWRLPDYFAAVCWAHERFRLENQRRSFNIELGGGFMGSSDYDPQPWKESPFLTQRRYSLILG